MPQAITFPRDKAIVNNANSDNNRISVYIFGDISSWYGVSNGEIRDALANSKDASGIDVYISTYGGDANEAFIIYDMLKGHPAPVTVYGSGIVASAGTIICCAADKVVLSEQCMFMIHNAQGVSYGSAEDHRKNADLQDKFDNRIVDLYARKTGLPKDEILSMMNDDTWMEPNDALSLGFVNEVSESICFDFEVGNQAETDENGWFYNQLDKADQPSQSKAINSKKIYRSAVFNYLGKGYKQYQNKKRIRLLLPTI